VKVGRTFPEPIEDHQLLLDEQGLGHHGTRAAGPASRATVVRGWRNMTTSSRMAQS